MNSLLKKLFDTYPVIPLDGAWGTELTNRGLPPGETPEKWNIDFPEKVAEILKRNGFEEIEITKDYAGTERIIKATNNKGK